MNIAGRTAVSRHRVGSGVLALTILVLLTVGVIRLGQGSQAGGILIFLAVVDSLYALRRHRRRSAV